MKSKLMLWMSGAAIVLVGCATDSSHVSNQSSQNSYDHYPTQLQPQSQETRDYAPRQEPYPQPALQYSETVPQQPQGDYQTQGSAPQHDDVPTVVDTRDFERPLAEQGRWLDTPEFGRVWQPHDQPNEWRPYSSDGRWVYTSYGWTWESSQPWGWACYHYGNWVFQPRCGWVWVPGTVWAPAWVVWRECDDYVAWAPCPPPRGPRFFASFEYCDGVRYFDFVVVERHNFCRPISPVVVIAPVHNVKIVNKTVNITKIKVVNKVAVNYGPQVTKVEQSTHQKVRVEKVSNVVKAPEQFVTKNREALVHQEDGRQERVRTDTEREKANRANLKFEKPAKQQAHGTSPNPTVSALRTEATPVPIKREEKKADKQERANRPVIHHDSSHKVDNSRVTQPEADRMIPRESRTEQRPAPEMRSALQHAEANEASQSDRKNDKQVQREQRRQSETTYTPYTPRPTNNMPAGPSERSQNIEKQSRKEQARNREVTPPSDQPVAPDQKNGDGYDRKQSNPNGQSQPHF